MSTATAEDVAQETTADHPEEDNLAHLLCGPCALRAIFMGRPQRAYCGKVKLQWDVAPTTMIPCLVCQELKSKPCAMCGRLFLP